MEKLNKKYDIKIEILTPLSIGAGAEKDWVKGVDFVEKNGSVYKLNLRKMLANGIDAAKLSSLFEKKDDKGILNFVDKKLDYVSDGVWKLPVSSQNDVKSFVKNQLSGKPIIPGSSLKGAIRSVLFEYLGGNTKDGKKVFGSSTKGDEFMRFVKLSDIEFDHTELVNTKIFNLQGSNGNRRGGWKHEFRDGTSSDYKPTGFNTIYESLVPSQSSYGTIMLSETSFNLYGKDKQIKGDKKEKTLDINLLCHIINAHTKKYLLKERAFFAHYATDKTPKIIDSIDHLLSQISNDNTSCILKMSAGSGFHSITGDWQFNEYYTGPLDRKRGGQKPKSRKIAIHEDNFSLMGFIKISLLSDEEKQEIEQRRIEKQNKIAEERAAAAKKKEEEERLAKEFQQKQNEYDSLIETAKQYENNQEFELALDKYRQAELIFPEENKLRDAITYLENEVQRIKAVKERQKVIDEAKNQEEVAKRKRLERGMAILTDIDANGKFKICDYKRVNQEVERWLKQTGNQSILSDQISILTETLARIYTSITKEKDKKIWIDLNSNIWKAVEKWTNTNIAHRMYEEITSTK